MPIASPAGVVPDQDSQFVLTMSCADRPGIVRAVSGFLYDTGCNIIENQQFRDEQSANFFMRTRFTAPAQSSVESVSNTFGPAVAARFAMTWRLTDPRRPMHLIVMVSKYGHCLNDLLYRVRAHEFPAEIVAVVSNHPDLAGIADSYRIPFIHIPVTKETKPAAEEQLLNLVRDLQVDLVVLARYMQILSPNVCAELRGRAINIHHSMLPSFKGARPYDMALERGVKLVGATAHYVTANLDEGPIIEQEVARIDHSLTAEQVTVLGRDNESAALSRAVRWHVENRVQIDGSRTIILR